jgi:hypothetical protein
MCPRLTVTGVNLGVVKEKEEEEEEEEEEEDDEEAGAGVFGGGSTNRSCRPCRETVLEGCGGGRFKCGDEAQGRQEQRERRVQYKGVWYTVSTHVTGCRVTLAHICRELQFVGSVGPLILKPRCWSRFCAPWQL